MKKMSGFLSVGGIGQNITTTTNGLKQVNMTMKPSIGTRVQGTPRGEVVIVGDKKQIQK